MYYFKLIIYIFIFTLKFIFVILPSVIFISKNKKQNIPQKAEKRNLIYISFIEWQGAYQRPQHLADNLSEKMNVFYISVNRIHHLIKRNHNISSYDPIEKIKNNLTVISPAAFPFDSKFSFFRALNNIIILYAIKKYISKEDRDNAVVMVNAPYFNSAIDRLDYSILVYDIMDELTYGKLSLVNDEINLMKKADILTAGTNSVCENKTRISGREIKFIPCGVDYEHFHAPVENHPEKPDRIDDIEKPIVGFFGAINERIDFEIVNYLCDKVIANFLFIGPVYSSAGELPEYNNLFFIGSVDYQNLPRYLYYFDIAIVPYKLTEGIQYVNPVKVLEYMAGERTVISTAIPDVEKFFGDCVEIANSKEEFGDLLNKLLVHKNIRKIKIGNEKAQSRSWSKMADEFYSEIIK